MNLTATHQFLPDYSRQPAWEQTRIHYPVARTPDPSNLATGDDFQRSTRDAGTYKYYVLSDTRDMVYTNRRNLETLFHTAKGGIVNLYA